MNQSIQGIVFIIGLIGALAGFAGLVLSLDIPFLYDARAAILPFAFILLIGVVMLAVGSITDSADTGGYPG